MFRIDFFVKIELLVVKYLMSLLINLSLDFFIVSFNNNYASYVNLYVDINCFYRLVQACVYLLVYRSCYFDPKDVEIACKECLQRLKIDYLDLFLVRNAHT